MAKVFTNREENYSQWYNDLVLKADLAENSDVRGCMVIKPYGYAIWEKMRDALDKMFKDTGHVNAYFPLFIPKSFFSKEASHVEGFAKPTWTGKEYNFIPINNFTDKQRFVNEISSFIDEFFKVIGSYSEYRFSIHP